MRLLTELTPSELRRHTVISGLGDLVASKMFERELEPLLCQQMSQGGGFLYLRADNKAGAESYEKKGQATSVYVLLDAIEHGSGLMTAVPRHEQFEVFSQAFFSLTQELGSFIEPIADSVVDSADALAPAEQEPARKWPFLIISELESLPAKLFRSANVRGATLSQLRALNIGVVFLEYGQPRLEAREYQNLGAHINWLAL